MGETEALMVIAIGGSLFGIGGVMLALHYRERADSTSSLSRSISRAQSDRIDDLLGVLRLVEVWSGVIKAQNFQSEQVERGINRALERVEIILREGGEKP